MNWKTKVVSTALALSVLIPTVALAADDTSTTSKLLTKGFGLHQRMDDTQRQAMKEQLLDLVDKYTPESAEEWKNALAEQEQLATQLKEKFQISDEVKEKIEAIRTQIKDGTL